MRTSARAAKWARAAVVCSFVCFLAIAQTGKPISRNGLIKALKIGGLTQKELVDQVNARGVNFEMSRDAEAELRAAGASSELIDAIREKARRTTPSHSSPQSPPGKAAAQEDTAFQPAGTEPTPVWAPGVYVGQDDHWAALLEESVNWKKGNSLRRFTVGFGKEEYVGAIPGKASPNGFRVPITFRIAAPEGYSAENYALVLLHLKGDLREVRVSGSGSSASNLVHFRVTPVDSGLWEIVFSQGIGEYGLLPPVHEGDLPIAPKMYTFRVVP